jgi:hypothetical protein
MAAERRPALGTRFAEISSDLALLGLHALALAKAEGRTATRAALIAVATALGALGVAISGALTLVSALVLIAIALGLPPWAAALVIGGALTVGGAVALQIALDMLRRVRFEFPETRSAMAESVEWLKALRL